MMKRTPANLRKFWRPEPARPRKMTPINVNISCSNTRWEEGSNGNSSWTYWRPTTCDFFKKSVDKYRKPPYICIHKQQAKVAQLVERNLAKVEVASSNLVFRSTQTPSIDYEGVFSYVPVSLPRLTFFSLSTDYLPPSLWDCFAPALLFIWNFVDMPWTSPKRAMGDG